VKPDPKSLIINQPKRNLMIGQIPNTKTHECFSPSLRWLKIYTILLIVAFLMTFFFKRPARPVLEVKNVHYVDCLGSNFLFRGGLPLTGEPPVFNYRGLKQSIVKAGQKAGVIVPSEFYMIDVNLLNIENPEDAGRILIEQQFFQAKSQLGRVQIWGMNGTGLSVNDPALADCREYLARNLDQWLNDKLISRVKQLRKLLESPAPGFHDKARMPVVIYIHCVAGCDRTGEFSGAYYLRYLHKSWEEVNAINRSLSGGNRPFSCKNYRAVQWYSLWLNLERGFNLNWREEFFCSGR
jgi:hypothetical protein